MISLKHTGVCDSLFLSPLQPRRLIDLIRRNKRQVHRQVDERISHMELGERLTNNNPVFTEQESSRNVSFPIGLVVNHLNVVVIVVGARIDLGDDNSAATRPLDVYCFRQKRAFSGWEGRKVLIGWMVHLSEQVCQKSELFIVFVIYVKFNLGAVKYCFF